MIRRLALLAAVLGLALAGFAAAQTDGKGIDTHIPGRAAYGDPTARYDHGVLGDALEWGSLQFFKHTCKGCAGLGFPDGPPIVLPPNRVFEDIHPRLVPIAPGRIAAMVVESDLELGARLALYDKTGLIAATPFIGRRNRWLAPLGAYDLDGDGFVELAYIDRPHLARTLRIWRFRDGALHHVADRPDLTNHRIGEDFISGGLRNCDGVPEIVTANGNWTRLMAARLKDGAITVRDIGPFRGRDSFAAALDCG